HDVAGDFEKIPFVFERDKCLASTVVHCNLQRLGQRPHRLDVPLNAQVAENDKARLNWQSLQRRVNGDHQGNPCFARNVIAEEIDGFNVEIGDVDLLPNAQLHLLAHQICEGPANRLAHQSFDSTRDLELTGTR